MRANLRDIVERNRSGAAVALPSVCSSHPDVIAAAALLARRHEQPLLVEATSNQVNQFGGYTGMKAADFIGFVNGLRDNYPWMSRALLLHYARLYGARTERIVGRATSTAGLGRHFGAHLYEAEVRYLVANEWAQTPEDVLHRRTKQELHMSPEERSAFAVWFEAELRQAA